MCRLILVAVSLLVFTNAALAQERTSAPDSAKAYIVSPANDDIVSNPVTIIFGLSDMGVAPAGMERIDTGHHHLLIDADLPYLDEPIPANDNHIHFGGGQTEVTIELAPGKHTLQLLLGDLNHIPHDPPVMSGTITITIE